MTRFAPFALLALTTGCTPASRHLVHGAGDAVSRMLLLFVLGTVLVALVTARMEKLELEVAARPMHSFAVGLVGMLVTAAGLVILCVTVVGIPVAAIAAMVLILAGYSGVCAVLVTVGGALIRHRTDNPYLHLALGCVLLLVVGAIPWIGDALVLIVALTGFGAVLSTRFAGLLPMGVSFSRAAS